MTGRKGATHTEETKQLLSELAKERCSKPEDNPFYGKRHTEESKRQMSVAHKNIPKEKHGRYGKSVSQNTIEAIRKAHNKQVLQYDKEGKFIAQYESVVEAAKAIDRKSVV